MTFVFSWLKSIIKKSCSAGKHHRKWKWQLGAPYYEEQNNTSKLSRGLWVTAMMGKKIATLMQMSNMSPLHWRQSSHPPRSSTGQPQRTPRKVPPARNMSRSTNTEKYSRRHIHIPNWQPQQDRVDLWSCSSQWKVPHCHPGKHPCLKTRHKPCRSRSPRCSWRPGWRTGQ